MAAQRESWGRHEQRIRELEDAKGQVLSELAFIRRELQRYVSRIEQLELRSVPPRAEMDSSADVSIRPNRVGLRFKNVSPWAMVGVVFVVTLGVTVAAILWLLR